MEQQSNRRPSRKLGFGDMFGLGKRDDGAAMPVKSYKESVEDNNKLIKKLAPWLLVVGIAVFVFDLFRDKDNSTAPFNTGPQIMEMEWKGTVLKKYVDMPGNKPHPTLEIKDLTDTAAVRQVVDFKSEKSGFWDKIEVKDKVSKPKGSLSVKVKNYVRDTTLVLKFE